MRYLSHILGLITGLDQTSPTLTFLVKNWKPTLALLTPSGKPKPNSKDFICKRIIKL